MATVYDLVTEEILKQLEAGTVPWRKPWNAITGIPKRLGSEKLEPYRGINVWLLAHAPYASPYWITFRGAKRLGGYVKAGEKGRLVVYFGPAKSRKGAEESEESEERPNYILRYYKVFNSEQCVFPEALQTRIDACITPAENTHVPIEACEAVLEKYLSSVSPPSLGHGGNRACYSPSADSIQMPSKESFESPAEYYSTLFHEMAHSTGHRSRLNREELENPVSFGSHDYSREELTAEFAAAFLCGTAGIDGATIENSAAYIANWSRKLRKEPRWAEAPRWLGSSRVPSKLQ